MEKDVNYLVGLGGGVGTATSTWVREVAGSIHHEPFFLFFRKQKKR